MKVKALIFAVAAITSMTITAYGQDNVSNTRVLVENIEKTVETLKSDIASLDQGISDADYALRNGEKMFDNLIGSTQGVLSSIDENSDTWVSLTSVINDFQEQQARVTQLATESNDQRLRTIADLWGKKAKEADLLRDDISGERARARSLLESLKGERLIVVEFIKLGAAEQVLESMRAVRDNLQSVNVKLDEMLTRAEALDSGLQN